MKNGLFPLGLFILWLVSYIIYPLWDLPQENLRGIVFAVLLIFFIVNFLLIDRFISSMKLPYTSISSPSIKKEKIVWLSGIIYFLFEFYPMTLPIFPRSDEEHHLTSSLTYYMNLSSLGERFFGCLSLWWIWPLAFLFIIFIIKTKSKSFVFYFLVSGAIIYYILFNRFVSIESFFYLFRFPPISKIFYIMAYSLFGVREFGPRLIQAILGFLSAVYLYKLVSLYRAREIALFSFIIWLFMPACLFFGNLGYLTCGESFFFTSSFYYLVRFIKNRDRHSLFYGSFILSIGTMYKQPIILALFIYYIYLFLLRCTRSGHSSMAQAGFILPGWVILVTALPYLFITKFIYPPFDYAFFPGNLFSICAYMKELKTIFSGLSIIHILFLIIGFITTIKRRDIFSQFIFIWFMGYFLLQVVYPYAGVFRLLVPCFPVLAIWIGEGINEVARKKTVKALEVLILLLAVIISTIWVIPPVSPKIILYHDIHSRYLPYPQAIRYLKENLFEGERVLCPGHSSPEKFYSLKFGLPISQIDHTVWKKSDLQSADNLYEYAKSHGIKFCIFPSGKWPASFLDFSLRDSLVKGEDKRFILEKAFYFGYNRLWILKVR